MLWKHAFPSKSHPKNDFNSFATPTPTVDQQRLYVTWTTPERYAIAAIRRDDGQEAWCRDLGPFVTQHGSGASPILWNDLVLKLPYCVTPVARGNLLFLWADQGIVTCLDAPSGKRLWQQRVGGKFLGSPVRVRDRLYCIARDGEVVVLAAADHYRLLGRTKLGEPSHSTPAIAGGVMYLRTQTQLMAIGGR